MNVLDIVLINPIINLLVAFYQGLTFLHVPFALGFSIILMTVFIRLLMAPLTAGQIKMSKKMQEMSPHLKKIREKHKGNMQRQQQETMALYQKHGVNPAAGCLPGIVQIVVLAFGVYPALLKLLDHTKQAKETLDVINAAVYFPFLHLDKPWDTMFFGFPLQKTPADLLPTIGFIVFLIPVLTGAFQLIQSKMMMPVEDKTKPVVQQQKPSQEDMMMNIQKQFLYLIPLMVGFFSYTFSVGLSLYWNTFTVFGIIQQYRIQGGWGSLSEWVKYIPGKKN